MKTVLAIVFTLTGFAQSLPMGSIPIGGGGTGPPAFVSATSGQCVISGSTCPLSTIDTSATKAVFLTFTTRATRATCDSTVTSVTGGSGGSDTYSLIASYPAICMYLYANYNVQQSASYQLNINITGVSIAQFLYTAHNWTLGAVGGTLDGSACTGTNPAGTSVTCSSSITPIGANEILLAALATHDYMEGGGVATDNSSPAYTIPTNGVAGGGGNFWPGGAAMSYIISTSGSYTPGFKTAGAGDDIYVLGVAIK